MRLMLALAILYGCRESLPAKDAGAPPAPVSSSTTAASPQVRYDCGFVAISEPACAAGAEWIAELDRLGAAFLEPKDDLGEEHCRRTDEALDRALAADLSALTPMEKVVAQNGALRAFGPHSCDRYVGGVAKKAAQVVLRFALPARTLRELGSEPFSDLDEWLGPRASWVDRKTKQTALFHDTMEFFTQAFRPVRSGSMRAVVSQLIAVDADWRVHVTPIVGRIELREDEGLDAPACVGKLDARFLRCDRGRVRPVAEERLPENVFVKRSAPGFVDCNRCHAVPDASANLIDLPPEERAQLEERRASFLVEAEQAVRSVRSKTR